MNSSARQVRRRLRADQVLLQQQQEDGGRRRASRGRRAPPTPPRNWFKLIEIGEEVEAGDRRLTASAAGERPPPCVATSPSTSRFTAIRPREAASWSASPPAELPGRRPAPRARLRSSCPNSKGASHACRAGRARPARLDRFAICHPAGGTAAARTQAGGGGGGARWASSRRAEEAGASSATAHLGVDRAPQSASCGTYGYLDNDRRGGMAGRRRLAASTRKNVSAGTRFLARMLGGGHGLMKTALLGMEAVPPSRLAGAGMSSGMGAEAGCPHCAPIRRRGRCRGRLAVPARRSTPT